MQAFNDDNPSRVINCISAFKVWQFLLTTHEGTSQVMKVKIDLSCSQYENFCMPDNESIDDMVTRFTKIINGRKIDKGTRLKTPKSTKDHKSSFNILGSKVNNFEGAQR